MKVEEENEILKDLLSYAIGDWDLELKDDEGMAGTPLTSGHRTTLKIILLKVDF